MNKKFLSAVLFGALMVSSTGTFVSCKDYDDDITNLQDQIDQQKTLSEKLAAVETSISNLQSAQTELGQQIANVQSAAEEAALKAQEAAIKAAKEDLEAAKSELKKAIEASASATEESIKKATEAINTELAKVQGQVETLMALNDKVTSLEAADVALAGSIAELDKKVAENAVAIGKMEAALAAQQTALEEFKTATGTDVAGIQEEIKKLQDALDNLSNTEDFSELASNVKALQDKVTSLSTEIQNINSELDMVWAAIAKGVTHVSLHAGGSIEASGSMIINDKPVVATQANVPLLSARALSTWTFGEDYTNAVSFVKGERTRLKATMVVRVSPVTASLDKKDIHFISTQLENGAPVDLVEKGLVEVVDVKPYDGEVLTRAVSSTGLWTVEVEVNKDYDETDFDKATTVVKNDIKDEAGDTGNQISTPSEKSVLFAVKVADSDNVSRAAVSEYALAFTKEEATPKDELDYFVWVDNKGYNVENLHNRFKYSEEDPTQEVAPKEYTWKSGVAATPVFEGALANTNEDTNDDRQTKCITNGVVAEPVVSSTEESFKIKLSDDILASATHFYVELDKKRALSSDDSEIRTWNLYEPNIIGINEVYEVKSHGPEVTIGFKINDINDVIGFRVYAVNSNGTLVDPDGRAFYVRVGAVADVISAETTIIGDANFTGTVTNMLKNQSAKVDVAQAMKDRFAKEDADKTFNDLVLKTDKVYKKTDGTAYSTNAFYVYFEVEGEDELIKLDDFKTQIGDNLTDLAKIKSIVTTRNENIQITDYVDDQVYNGTVSITNKNGIAISTLNVSMKKVVPTTLPAGTKWNPAQLQSDGKTYKCYVLPNVWGVTNATTATMKITDMFDIDEKISDANQYAFYFTTNDPKVNRKVAGYADANLLTLTKADNEFKMIDDVTPYDAYVTYNYGKVSSKTPTLDIVIDNQKENWKAIYCNIHGASYSFDWTKNDKLETVTGFDEKWMAKEGNSIAEQAAKVTYGVDFHFYISESKSIYMDTAIYGTSAYHAIYNGWLANYKYGLEIVKEKCSFETSDNPGKPSRYFKIVWSNNRPTSLDALDFNSNPTGNVAAVLKITVKDNFGNERVIEMDMTIVPNI